MRQTLQEKLAGYGQWTYRGAWALEILAALLGLATGLALGYQSFSTADPGSVTSTDLALASAPFFMVAVAELTKIPIATLLYSVSWFWKPFIFMFLLALAGITFETVFMGLERAVTLRQLRYDEIAKKISELKLESTQLLQREANRDEALKKAQANLSSLTKQADDEHKSISAQIDDVSKQIAGGTEPSPEQIQIQRKIDARVADRGRMIRERDDSIDKFVKEFERQRDSYVQRIDDARKNHDDGSVRRYEDELAKLANPRSRIESQYAPKIDQIESDINTLKGQLEQMQDRAAQGSDNTGAQMRAERDRLKSRLEQVDQQWRDRLDVARKQVDDALESGKTASIDDPRRLDEIAKQLSTLETSRIETSRIDQVRRIASRIYGTKPEDVTNEQAGLISIVWFGSLAVLAALAGPLTAMVALALQGIASAEPSERRAPGKLSRLTRRMLLRWRWRRVRTLRVPVEVTVDRIIKEILYVPLLTDDPDAVRQSLKESLSPEIADLVSISMRARGHAGTP
jgi:ElaB/YqjD/DUF883 family membrane-anchored ribosome-binding protein